MKFGTFYEHQLPRPWREDSELRLFQEALDQVELADRLGLDYMWEVEHHFLEEYAHSSAPEIFLAACSQRTRQIRLGHGVVLLPPGYNHPARVAERIATLDLVSNGRIEFGTGESSAEAELGGFGIAREHKREMWRESLEAICRMFVEQPFAGHQGKHFQMPPRNVVPKPVQKPHPPLWVACSRRETILLAARLGIGALTFAFISPEEARQWVNDYYKTLAEECTPIGSAVNANIAVVTGFMCDRDEAKASKMGDEGLSFFAYSLGHHYVFGRHEPGKTDLWANFKNLGGAMPPPANGQPAQGFGRDIPADAGLNRCVGTPAQLAQKLGEYEQAGVDQVIFVSQAGNNRHEDICASLELFAREVMPQFRERDQVEARRKQERLAPVIEQAMKRRIVPSIPPSDRPTVISATMQI